MKAILIGFILALLLSASQAGAQTICATQASNASDDVIETWTDWVHTGDTSFRWNVYIDGVVWNDYGAQAETGGGSCDLHHCFPLKLQAQRANVVIEARLLDGHLGDWRCVEQWQIIGHVDRVSSFTPISQEEKTNAQWWSDRMGDAKIYLGALGTLTAFTGDFGVAALFGAGATIAGIADVKLKRIIADPFDENYGSPYDPPLQDAGALGLEYCWQDSFGDGIVPWLCNQIVDRAREMDEFADGAVVSMDRSASCAQVGNMDCAQWQQDRMNYFLRLMGDQQSQIASLLYQMSEEFAANGYNPCCDPSSGADGIYALQFTAAWLGDSGNYWKGR